MAEANVTDVQIPPTATPMVSPEPASGIPVHPPTIPLLPLNQQSQPAAGSYIHEPILTTDYSQVEIPSSASNSTEGAPRRKVSRRDSAAHDGEVQVGSDSSVSPTNTGGDLKIDEWTMRLGISWATPEENAIALACLRGYQTFIEKHYPITNAKIVAQNKQHCICLVDASQGWYLFDEDLRNGKLLARSKEAALRNLMQNPVVFEGQEALEAGKNDTTETSDPKRVSQDSQEDMVVGRMELD